MSDIADELGRLIEAVARLLLGDPNPRLSSKTEMRYGTHGSLAIDKEKGVWHDHETDEGGGTLDLIHRQTGLAPNGPAMEWLRQHGLWQDHDDRSKANGIRRSKVVASYDYVDKTGEPLFRVDRLSPKAFRQRRRANDADNPSKVRDGWVYSVSGMPQVPYHLPELDEAIGAERLVFIVEGEKDTDNLRKLGAPATTNAMGAGKWPSALNQYFAGADVVIIPDNDEAGRKHVALVGAALIDVAARVRVLYLPGLPEKGDVSDWITAGGTLAALYDLVETTARPFGEVVPEGAARLVLTSRQFVEGFVAPDYAIDGIAQRSFIYSFTGQTGSGKTSILLHIAYCKAMGISLAGHAMDKAKVLICAGENPTDARMRWIAMADKLGFDLDKIEVYWIDGAFDVEELYERIAAEVKRLGGVDLVIVDTSAAFFRGEEENNNTQIGNHARTLRRLTTLEGRPCVIVACHPVKKASGDNLLPRGGGAFLAEMDGNFTASEREGIIEMHWQGKLRGPDFQPIIFQVRGTESEALKDSKGRLIQTVMARVITSEERAQIEAGSVREEDAVLLAMHRQPGASLRELASSLGWVSKKDGEPDQTKVRRTLLKLSDKSIGLTKKERKNWALTAKGHDEAEKLALKVDLLNAVRSGS